MPKNGGKILQNITKMVLMMGKVLRKKTATRQADDLERLSIFSTFKKIPLHFQSFLLQASPEG